MPLNVFQIIVLPIMAFLFVERAAAVARGKIPRRVAFFWMCVWLFGGIAVAFPDATSAIARPLGIARGADLVFYLAILFMLVGFYMMYVRLRRLDANITQLVRHLAIQNAQSGSAANDATEVRRQVEQGAADLKTEPHP
jgi:hypothetical protein